MPYTQPTLHWSFPLPRTHTGALLGNGVQGLMVWGVDTLNITVGRAGFWDHRGGNAFASRTTYNEVRTLLEAGDEPALRRVFARPDQQPGAPDRPTQIGCGRLELRFGALKPLRAELHTADASLHVTLADAAGKSAQVIVRQAMHQELAWVELDETASNVLEVKLVPTWQYVGAQLAAVGVQPPEALQVAAGGGFVQRLPADQPLALAWTQRTATTVPAAVVIATALGDSTGEQAIALVGGADLASAAEQAAAWWQQYWQAMPQLHLPDDVAQYAWDYGVYKLAGLTTPGGVPAALQGAWIEEYQLPPWSNDYHFNINIQMIYWPCLATGRFAHFWPLWNLILGWMEQMQANGATFFGASDALLMPHAVDDRCQAVGAFWTGMIDQACAAWMAQLAWLHYRYSGDERVLRAVAWPLLNGAFNGYWAMLEPHAGKLSLPVSVSPEYNAAEMNAWGRDASFQLAALHFLADALPQAAQLLNQPADPRWERVQREVPPYTLTGPAEQPRIALWQGQDLAESHRHHSHLGSIYPFCTVDPADPAHTAVVERSIGHWIHKGAGAWSGWCVPWASVLCARTGMPDAAVHWLHWWRAIFTNQGGGTLHNAAFPGFSVIWGWPRDEEGELIELMQIDAGMGAVTAVQELLLQQRGDTLTLLPGLPQGWHELRFDGLWAEGGFRVGATVEQGRVREVRVESTRGGTLKLAHGIAQGWELDGQQHNGPVLEQATTSGQMLTLRPIR